VVLVIRPFASRSSIMVPLNFRYQRHHGSRPERTVSACA
jgi:hypothetical protein